MGDVAGTDLDAPRLPRGGIEAEDVDLAGEGRRTSTALELDPVRHLGLPAGEAERLAAVAQRRSAAAVCQVGPSGGAGLLARAIRQAITRSANSLAVEGRAMT